MNRFLYEPCLVTTISLALFLTCLVNAFKNFYPKIGQLFPKSLHPQCAASLPERGAHCARKGRAQWPKSMLERVSNTYTRLFHRRYTRTKNAPAGRATVRGVLDSHSFWCNENVLETIGLKRNQRCKLVSFFHVGI